jgi:integrase
MLTRTWTDVMEQMCRRGKPSTQVRCRRVFRSNHFDPIRDKVLVQTTADDLLAIINTSGNSIVHYLRRLHNFAVDLHWLPWPALPKAGWPKLQTKKARAITAEEHARIVASELNPEKRAYYEFLWHSGAAQSDAAETTAEQFNWNEQILVYQRLKIPGLGGRASLNVGPKFRELVQSLPTTGPLFPTIITAGANARATEFRRRCKLAKVSGVSLHSYRYAWAHRARQAGLSLREAQAALGHSSRAVHEAYAGNDPIIGRSLEEYEAARAAKIIPMPVSPPQTRPPVERAS